MQKRLKKTPTMIESKRQKRHHRWQNASSLAPQENHLVARDERLHPRHLPHLIQRQRLPPPWNPHPSDVRHSGCDVLRLSRHERPRVQPHVLDAPRIRRRQRRRGVRGRVASILVIFRFPERSNDFSIRSTSASDGSVPHWERRRKLSGKRRALGRRWNGGGGETGTAVSREREREPFKCA